MNIGQLKEIWNNEDNSKVSIVIILSLIILIPNTIFLGIIVLILKLITN